MQIGLATGSRGAPGRWSHRGQLIGQNAPHGQGRAALIHSSEQQSHPVLIGYWAGANEHGWPSPTEFVDANWSAAEREIVAEYLVRGLVTRAFMGYSPCRMCGRQNGDLELSDGTYVWPEGFAHYLIEHDVRPPEVFVSHVLERVERLAEVVYDDSWWRSFAKQRPDGADPLTAPAIPR